eukprot:scaffold10615_cov106-Isochrysis_galbana.AAC.8
MLTSCLPPAPVPPPSVEDTCRAGVVMGGCTRAVPTARADGCRAIMSRGSKPGHSSPLSEKGRILDPRPRWGAEP